MAILLKVNKNNCGGKYIDVSLVDFEKHFSKLGNREDVNDSFDEMRELDMLRNDDNLDFPVTLEEVELMIKKLKNSKACGIDKVRNEYLKSCSVDMLEVLVRFLNIILDTGVVPTEWCIGIIIPIFKNKGENTNPDNYRGITLLSCLGKLFTSILNNRIFTLLEDGHLLGEEQTGFRPKYSTLDNVFVLKNIIDFYLINRKRLYCAFVDFKKAFDLIDRISLWFKMLKIGIHGKIFRVIRNIYDSAKSCISVNGKFSD